MQNILGGASLRASGARMAEATLAGVVYGIAVGRGANAPGARPGSTAALLHPDQENACNKFDEMRQFIKQRDHAGRDGPHKARSGAFLAAVRAIESGRSRLTIWQALQIERSRNRVLRLRRDLLKKVGELRADGRHNEAEDLMPKDEDGGYQDKKLSYPVGSWVCPDCGRKNFPREERCRESVRGVRCSGAQPAEMVGQEEQPPKRGPRSYEARKRQSLKKTEGRRESLKEAALASGWACAGCGEMNVAPRRQCFKC